jgi:hypothetical protein
MRFVLGRSEGLALQLEVQRALTLRCKLTSFVLKAKLEPDVAEGYCDGQPTVKPSLPVLREVANCNLMFYVDVTMDIF